MASLVNNCVFAAAASGTGAFGMSAAVTGYQTPAAAGVVDTTKTYRYRAQSSDLSQWEEGNTVSSSTATSFTRVVTASSAGGTTTVSFTNPPQVALTMMAADVLQFDDAMSLTTAQQAQARANLYAAPFDALAYNGMQVNGSCDVSQEWGTTSKAISTLTAGYGVDVWNIARDISTYDGSIQQVSDAPPGYSSSLKVTITTGNASPGSSAYFYLQNLIEGYRIARLAFGSASAQPISFGFWVKATRTGLHGGSLRNGSATFRSYPFTYTINSANTWEFKTVTVTGDTTGTWNTTNGVGLNIFFDIGSGSSNLGTAGSWANQNVLGASGGVNNAQANTDTFQITGLIVLPGIELPSSTRAPLIMRPFNTELILCKRYYQSVTAGLQGYFQSGYYYSGYYPFPVSLRATPTITRVSDVQLSGFANYPFSEYPTIDGFRYTDQTNATGQGGFLTNFTVDARL